MHAPDEGHVSSQLPPEQSVAHGGEAHVAVQLPEEHAHVLPVQVALLVREEAVPGSAIAGPPLGLPVVVEVLDPPHDAITELARTMVAKRRSIIEDRLSKRN